MTISIKRNNAVIPPIADICKFELKRLPEEGTIETSTSLVVVLRTSPLLTVKFEELLKSVRSETEVEYPELPFNNFEIDLSSKKIIHCTNV